MRGATGGRLVLGMVAGLAAAPGARAEDFATLLKGQWVTEGGDCAKPGTLVLSGDMLRLTNATGHADLERVFARRATGFATQLVRSAFGARIGSRTVYEFLGPDRISVTEAASGRSSTLVRCPEPLPADAPPQQMVEIIYRRYVLPDQLGTPFDSVAALRQFFAPELADHFVTWMNFSGIMPDGCVGNHDPVRPLVWFAVAGYCTADTSKILTAHKDLPGRGLDDLPAPERFPLWLLRAGTSGWPPPSRFPNRTTGQSRGSSCW